MPASGAPPCTFLAVNASTRGFVWIFISLITIGKSLFRGANQAFAMGIATGLACPTA